MPDLNAKRDHSGIQVIARAASILRALKEEKGGSSLAKVASKVGLPRSTVQRIAGALSSEGFVIQEPNGGGLRLGPALSAFADAADSYTRDVCRPVLTDLSQKTGETTDLAILRAGRMIFVDQIQGSHRLSAVSAVGSVFPLSTTANGRACLALMPEDEAKAHIRKETDGTISDADLNALLETIGDIRTTGLAYDNDEHTAGISAVGFAFYDEQRTLYAISVPVPTTRFVSVRERLEQEVLLARARIMIEFPR